MSAALEKPLVSGAKQTQRALQNGRALRVYIARDAASRVADPGRTAASEAGVPVCEVPTMRELGRSCGLKVGCACAATLRVQG